MHGASVVESSVMSRSQSSASSASGSPASQTSSIVSSLIFPLFDSITQKVYMPQFLTYLFLIYFLVQCVFTSLYLSTTAIFSDGFKKIIKSISVFELMDNTVQIKGGIDSNILIRFLINTIATVLIFFVFLIIMMQFKKSRRLHISLLYTCRFFVELFPLVFLIPTGQLFGELFKIFFSTKNSNTFNALNVVAFVFSFIEFLALMLLVNFSYNMIGFSAYLSISPLSSFNPRGVIMLILGNPVFALFSYTLAAFNSWLQHLVATIHIIYNVYLLFTFSKLFFVTFTGNVLFIGFAIWEIFLDLMFLIGLFFKSSLSKTMQTVFTILILVFMVISLVLSFIYVYFRNLRIRKDLYSTFNPNDNSLNLSSNSKDDNNNANLISENTANNNNDENEKLEIINFLKLDKNIGKMMTYMNYVVANHVMRFYDIPIIRYFLKNFGSTESLLYFMRITSFMPYMTSVLSAMIREANRRHDLKFKDRFFCYQMQRIRTLRQTSSSEVALKSLKELKSESKDMQMCLLRFWSKNNFNLSDNHAFYTQVQKLKSKWTEALLNFPNSSSFNEEYVTFLVECCTEFGNAIKIQHKIDLIESGYNFSVDNSFRHFIRIYPDYVKRKILDIKGRKIKISAVSNGSNSASNSNPNGIGTTNKSSGSSNRSSTMSSSQSTMDIAMEEEIGKVLITQARIRISMEHALKTRKADKHKPAMIISLVNFVIGIAMMCFLYIYFNSYFDDRTETTNRIYYINNVRLAMFTSGFSLLMHWTNKTNVMDVTHLVSTLQELDGGYDAYIGQGDNWAQHAVDFTIKAKNHYSSFVQEIFKLSDSGKNVYEYAKGFFTSETPLVYCDTQGVAANNIAHENLKTVILYMIFQVSITAGKTNFPDWLKMDSSFCEITGTLHKITNNFNTMISTIGEVAVESTAVAKKTVSFLEVVFPLFFGIVTEALFLTVMILYTLEIKNFLTLILHQPIEVVNNSMKPIRRNSSDDQSSKEGRSDIHSFFNIPILYTVLMTIFILVTSIIIYFHLNKIMYYNVWFNYSSSWSADSRIRKSLIMQIVYRLFLCALDEYPYVNNSPYFEFSILINEILADNELLDEKTNSLFTESGGTPSIAGLDDGIDRISLSETCSSNTSRPSFHENYRCSSAQALIAFFINEITNAINTRFSSELISSESLSNIFHLTTSHLIPKLEFVDEEIKAVTQRYNNDYKQIHVIFFVVEIILALICLLIFLLYISALNKCYLIALSLLRRISPISIVNDRKLLDYILNIKHNNDSQMSLDKNIIHHWSSCVICADSSGTIDSINPAVTNVFGYKPEQLLGQTISTIFQESEQEDINLQIKLIRNKQSPPNFSTHSICVSDSDSKVPCSLELMGIMDEGSEVSSFVAILSDESELVQQQQEAENAKKQSESLLYHILPRSIVIRLNQGEKDISFSVPNATIIFIDIVKFSDFSAQLTPQAIMATLSQLFGSFDEMLEEYNKMLKIKLIGDVYMCAAGLFSDDKERPQIQIQVDQAVKFGLDALQALDDMNMKMNTVLNVRIGINTGGPLIAGVLGTDKPIFDIIGDPINVASRLQSTCVPGTVQVSKTTYELLDNIEYHTELREDVFLKGKGKTQAYLIYPRSKLQFQYSNPNVES